MKRRVFKDWVVMVLGFVNILAVLVMASDCDNIYNFVITHVIALAIFIINIMLIIKYGKKELFK